MTKFIASGHILIYVSEQYFRIIIELAGTPLKTGNYFESVYVPLHCNSKLLHHEVQMQQHFLMFPLACTD